MIGIYILLGAMFGVMGYMFGYIKKNLAPQQTEKKTFPNVKQKLAEEIESSEVEKAFIKFILTEAGEEHIRLAKKNSDIYICFSNSEISDFATKWYGVLKSYKSGDIDERMYKSCVNIYFEE